MKHGIPTDEEQRIASMIGIKTREEDSTQEKATVIFQPPLEDDPLPNDIVIPNLTLPTDAHLRKNIPVATGFIDYFPDAIAEIAILSRIGNDQHNPDKPLHWDRAKSGDESDALMRHFLERGTRDTDGVRHSTKVAWRAMALLQKELEQEGL